MEMKIKTGFGATGILYSNMKIFLELFEGKKCFKIQKLFDFLEVELKF